MTMADGSPKAKPSTVPPTPEDSAASDLANSTELPTTVQRNAAKSPTPRNPATGREMGVQVDSPPPPQQRRPVVVTPLKLKTASPPKAVVIKTPPPPPPPQHAASPTGLNTSPQRPRGNADRSAAAGRDEPAIKGKSKASRGLSLGCASAPPESKPKKRSSSHKGEDCSVS